MKTFYETENECKMVFAGMGVCYHVYTPENMEIIWTDEQGFRQAMDIIGVCAKLSPDVKILTFQVMSNHLHFVAIGDIESIGEMFEKIKSMAKRQLASEGRTIKWDQFVMKHNLLNSLEQARNVIAYVNRNGFVVNPSCTPFSYPWGANPYYYNYCSEWFLENSTPMRIRQVRKSTHSRQGDSVEGLMCLNGYALPLSFCDVDLGMSLFRNAMNYFLCVAKNIENQMAIANEIGETHFYTDDELYSATVSLAHDRYDASLVSLTPKDRIALANTLHYDYHATKKQISRILKLNFETLKQLFPDLM